MKDHLSKDEQTKFIELVYGHPLLYDPSAKNSDMESSKAVWSRIATEMNIPSMSVQDWKGKWKCLRDTFVRKRREIRSGDSQEKIDKAMQWKFYHNMSFLEPFVDRICHKTVPKSNGLEYQHYTIIKNEEYDSEEEEGEECSTFSYGKRSCEDTAITEEGKRKRRGHDDELEMAEMSPIVEEESVAWNAEGSNSRSFFQSCAYRMDRLPQQVQSYLQLQISQLFFNAENPDVPPVPIMPLPSHSSNPTT